MREYEGESQKTSHLQETENRTLRQFLWFTFQPGARVGSSVGFLMENNLEFKNENEKEKEKLTLIFKMQPQDNHRVNRLILLRFS